MKNYDQSLEHVNVKNNNLKKYILGLHQCLESKNKEMENKNEENQNKSKEITNLKRQIRDLDNEIVEIN